MAIVYDGTGGVFTETGKIIGLNRNMEVYVEDGADDAVTEMETALDEKKADKIAAQTAGIDAFRAGIEAARIELSDAVRVRMLDRTSIIDELDLPSETDLDTTLRRFREQMVADSETVQACAVTLGSVTAWSGNDGNGTILTSKVLDGFSDPGDYFPADRGYVGLDSELCCTSETMTVECTADSQTSGRAEGAEAFKIFGGVPNPEDFTPTPYFGAGTEGSGSSDDAFIYGPHSGTLVNNPTFEDWTSDSPPVVGSWTLDSGTNNTHWKRSTSTNAYRGDYGGNFAGDGAQATIQISQAMTPRTKFRPLQRVLVSIRYKADASISAGTLGVIFEGTGYSAGGSESISIAHGSLATSWTLASFWCNLPAIIPTDFKLVVKVTNTLTNTKNIYIDDVYVQPGYWFGGLCVATVPGSSRTCVQDRWTFTVANDRAGKFQSFWARYFGRQLPSSGTPTISDTLADATALAPFSDSLGP